jgi:hypothetical protein
MKSLEMEGDFAMAKTKTEGPKPGERLIPYVKAGRFKKALPRLIEQQLAGEAEPQIDANTPWTMSIPDAGRRYFGLGKALSYAVAYPVIHIKTEKTENGGRDLPVTNPHRDLAAILTMGLRRSLSARPTR